MQHATLTAKASGRTVLAWSNPAESLDECHGLFFVARAEIDGEEMLVKQTLNEISLDATPLEGPKGQMMVDTFDAFVRKLEANPNDEVALAFLSVSPIIN